MFCFVGIAQFFVWLSQFFASVSAAAGNFFFWACGNFVLFGFRLFEKKNVELMALALLFRVGLAQFFFVGVGLSRHPVGLSQFSWARW